MKLLIIEDDAKILSLLEQGFSEAGHIIEGASLGEDGLYMAQSFSYDVIILDWMLPDIEGIKILKELRKQKISTPIIMLTARADIDDRVDGLSSGADDYLVKPFSFKELNARVEVLYKRVLSNGEQSINIGDVVIDFSSKRVFKDEKEINLTAKEYELLLLLIKHKNSYLSKFTIEDALWGLEQPSSNAVQVNIYNLRKKLGKELIKSFKGLGYKIEIQ